MRVAVMASGRGSNFDALAQAARRPAFPAEIVLVLSDQPEAPVLERARGFDVAVHPVNPGTRRGPWKPEGVEALLNALRKNEVDAVCLAGFMRILPGEIVRAYAGRILNIHPSLLPDFPGRHAVRDALQAGAFVTGCTVHFVDEGVDTGPWILQARVAIREGDTVESLQERIHSEEHRIYPEALRALAEGRVSAASPRLSLRKTR